jgi:hypothetical protein
MYDNLLVKLSLLLDNRIMGRLKAAKAQFKAGTDEIWQNISTFKGTWTNVLDDIQQELPLFGRAAKIAANPFTTITASVTDTSAGFYSSGKNIIKKSDVFYTTLNKGAAETTDIASYLPKAAPASKQAGLTLEKTAGSFAYFTAQGQSAEAATTMLQNTFKAVQNSDTIDNFKNTGVSVYNSKSKILEMTGIVGDLKERMNGFTDKQRAANASTIMMQDFKRFNCTVDFTENSQGHLNLIYENRKILTDERYEIINPVQAAVIKVEQAFPPAIKTIEDCGLWTTKSLAATTVSAPTGETADLSYHTEKFTNPSKTVADTFKFVFSTARITMQTFQEHIKDFVLWTGQKFDNVGGTKEILSRKITTPASERIKELQSGREAFAEPYKSTNISRVEEIRSAWKFKPEDDAEESKSMGGIATTMMGGTGAALTGGSATDSVTGTAKQIRNVTINIGSLNSGGINTANTTLQNMQPSQIEDWFNNMCTRVLRNMELSY